MSIENHPNLNAVGLLIDIDLAILIRLRGKGLEFSGHIITALLDDIRIFVDLIDEKIDIIVEEQSKVIPSKD